LIEDEEVVPQFVNQASRIVRGKGIHVNLAPRTWVLCSLNAMSTNVNSIEDLKIELKKFTRKENFIIYTVWKCLSAT